MPIRILGILLLLGGNAFAWAGDLAAPTVAKFIRVIASASGGSKVVCSDREIAGELTAINVPMEGDGKLVWATTEKDVTKFAKQGKLVICGSQDLLNAGAALAIVAEGGRPTIYISAKNLAASGITLSDSVMKIGKVVK
jgi:hypothetical protein